MTQHADGRSLYIEPAPSRSWRAFVLLLHLAAVAAVLLTDLPGWLQLAGSLPIGLSLGWEFRQRFPLRQPRNLRALAFDGDSNWWVHTAQDKLPARLLPASRLWSRMLWLRFESQGRRFWVLLPSDAVPADDFRRLQGRLRLAAQPDPNR